MLKYLISALFLAITPVSAQTNVTSGEDFVQKDFDVAGVNLGMSPDAAITELEKRGYTMVEEGSKTGTERGPSFNDLVKVASGEMKKSAAISSWRRIRFKKGAHEVIEVRFKPLPTGTAVESIGYSSLAPAMTWERLQAAVEKKYGKPRHIGRRLMRWSDMSLVGSQVNIAEGAIALDAAPRGNTYGPQGLSNVKGSVTLYRGKISLFDAKEEAKSWTPEVETTF